MPAADYHVFSGPAVDECSLASLKTQFSVCGTLANFVDQGIQIIDNDAGCQTGFELSINGVSYPGVNMVDDGEDHPCLQACTSSGDINEVDGAVYFPNAPICAS